MSHQHTGELRMGSTTQTSVLSDSFRVEPYWWEAAPLESRPVETSLPQSVDVVVIGSGYTGLSCALTLQRAGREVVVLEAQQSGFGASSRNAGYIGKTLKHSFSSLLSAAGENKALAFYREMQAAYDYVTRLITDNHIDCHYERCGRFMAAASAAQYESMAQELALKKRYLGDDFEMIPRTQLHTILGSDRYVGGAVIPALGGLHPGLYHKGLDKITRQAGVQIVNSTQALGITNVGSGFNVRTHQTEIQSRDVVIATNGYSGQLSPWLQQRLVPFRGFMMATEELPEALLQRVFPTSHTQHDFNNNLTYFRRAPDSPRILFGGLTATMTDDLPVMATRLHRLLTRLAPDLAGTRVSHMWNGYCAGTFDQYPHIGVHDGVHYAGGYCFAGLPMGTYLGHKIAQRIFSPSAGHTVFSSLEFPKKWWYRGTPWFLPLYMSWYNWLDWRGT